MECLQRINSLKSTSKKETYMCVVNKQDSQFPGSHWVMVYQDKKNTYFLDSYGRDFHYHGFNFKRPVYQVSRKLQCLHSKLYEAYLVFLDADWQRDKT